MNYVEKLKKCKKCGEYYSRITQEQICPHKVKDIPERFLTKQDKEEK